MNAVSRKQVRLPIGSSIGVSLLAVFFVAGLPGISTAQNQFCDLGSPGTFSPFFGDAAIVGGGYYPFRASTPAESYARGAAAYIRAQGEFNQLSSEAAINAEEARAKAIVNNQNAVAAYFKIREMNRDYRSAERGPRPTPEDLERYAQANRPAPLSPSELDTLTGRVQWPILLRADRFAALRAEMEELLDRWAVSHNLGQLDSFGTEQHLAVRRATDEMQEALRADIRDLPPQDYASAQRFLRSLEYQVLQPSTSSVSLADSR